MIQQLPPRLWPLREALAVLGNISRQTLARAEKTGRIKLVRIGTRVFVQDDELRRAVTMGLTAPANSAQAKEEFARC